MGSCALPGARTGERIAGWHVHATALASDAGRLAVAAGDEVSLFSLVMPGPDQRNDDLELRVDANVSANGLITYVATMPDASQWPMSVSLQAQVAAWFRYATRT